ncbi:hypothetical protein MMC07_004791 [Pseudocyphellaria aurata]|nr:hypothetical protein [Pseudocyphellaria aurata]
MASIMKSWDIPMPKPDVLQNQCNVSDDEDEHISHARHILSFYKFHVQGIDNLINRHDQEREARRKAEKELGGALKQIQAELNQTREQLAITCSELETSTAASKKTKEALNNAEKNLDLTRKELTTTKTQLQTTQADLSKTKDQLKISEGKLQRATAELSITNEKLKDLEGVPKERDNLKLAIQQLNGTLIEKTKDLKKANDGEREANDLVKAKEKEKDDAFTARDEAQTKYGNLLATNGNAFIHQENRKRGDYYIEYAAYGGNVVTEGVINKLLQHAVERRSFTIDDQFLCGGTKKNTKDVFTVVYAVKGKGPFKIVSKKEKDTMKFE